MNEQENRKKVINGLECCISGNPAICKRVGCPYAEEHDGIGDTCIDHLMADALALLKAQEPRVMTLEEVLALNPDTPIYIQHKSGESGWDIYRGIEDDITHDIVTGSLWAQGDYWYQKEYRTSYVCWTSRPTEAQREKVKWDTQEQRDYEAAVEMAEYCERYEPTYNADDGSM